MNRSEPSFAFHERNPVCNRNNEPVGYAMLAFFAAILLYNTWQFIIGALALMGLWYAFNQNDNNRRPPRCR